MELAQTRLVSVAHRLHVFDNSRLGHNVRHNVWDVVGGLDLDNGDGID